VEFTKRRELIRMRAEIDRLREENERLARLAYRDALTGLRNRRCFTERLNEELCRLRRNPGGALSVICIDVNSFKQLNDTEGHAAGDAALLAVAHVLESLVRAEDLVCRLGGDEFGVLLPDSQRDQAERVLARIIAHAPALAGVGLNLRPLALGLASWLPGDDEVSLLSRADDEMYADKRNMKRESGVFVSAA
jgi:diguanylate cyclase (GGDEF)-like protein